MCQAPPKPGDEQEPQCQAEKRMEIDPERLGLLGPRIVQESQDADHHHQQKHDPVKPYRNGVVALDTCRRKRVLQGIAVHKFSPALRF